MKPVLTFLLVLLSMFSARATVFIKHHASLKAGRIEKTLSLTKEQDVAADNAEPLPINEDDDEELFRKHVARCISYFYELSVAVEPSILQGKKNALRDISSTSSCKYILQRVLRI